MKRTIISSLVYSCLFTLLCFSLNSCSGKKKEKKAEPKPLNISIFLDLSDRLTRDMQPSQMSRDTAIVGYVVDYFKKQTLGPSILKSKNSIKVFFYPTPHSSDIATLSHELNINMENYNGKEKRIKLEEMKGLFQRNLTQIYNKTLLEKEWIGCDIWDFFSSKKVDAQCIKKDARNIMIILTDGYLYAENNKIEKGNSYSYIVPKTLKNQSSLIVARKGLENLEVGVFEINPYTKEQEYKMIPLLENWFLSMGVSKQALTVASTDLPANTNTLLESFLNHQ
jgi:hypothetical protein